MHHGGCVDQQPCFITHLLRDLRHVQNISQPHHRQRILAIAQCQLGRQHLRHQVAASHLINPRQRPGRTFQITTLHLGAHHVIAA